MAFSKNSLTLCIVIKAVEDGEMMIIGFICFFFCGLVPAAGGGGAACEPAFVWSSRRILRRGPMRARTDSKFCKEKNVSSCRRLVEEGKGTYVDPLPS